jgi:hypothetical protein
LSKNRQGVGEGWPSADRVIQMATGLRAVERLGELNKRAIGTLVGRYVSAGCCALIERRNRRDAHRLHRSVFLYGDALGTQSTSNKPSGQGRRRRASVPCIYRIGIHSSAPTAAPTVGRHPNPSGPRPPGFRAWAASGDAHQASEPGAKGEDEVGGREIEGGRRIDALRDVNTLAGRPVVVHRIRSVP